MQLVLGVCFFLFMYAQFSLRFLASCFSNARMLQRIKARHPFLSNKAGKNSFQYLLKSVPTSHS